jgi:DNA-binding transcriptional LysR family regulator
MTISLDQVRCFIAVAEELHFGRAAQRLQMTQPPLSRQIQKLERGVGAQLVERDSRQVSLTLAGQAFLEDAYRLLTTVDQAVDQARRVEAGSAGTLHLGVEQLEKGAQDPDGGHRGESEVQGTC